MSIRQKLQDHGTFLLQKLVYGPHKGLILCYHRVLPQALITGYGPNTGLIVPEHRFEQQMRYLAATCAPVSLDELLTAPPSGNKRPVAVTFDDGTADNLNYALPILEKYSIPATIYVTSGFVRNEFSPWWSLLWRDLAVTDCYTLACENLHWTTASDTEKKNSFKHIHKLMLSGNPKCYARINAEFHSKARPYAPHDRYLTPLEVTHLAQHPLITIGLHTHSHTPTRYLSDAEFEQEMTTSAAYLNAWTERPTVHFAYPYGTPPVLCHRAGRKPVSLPLHSATTTILGFVEPERPYALSRLSISGAMRMRHFQAMVGRYL